VSSGRTPDLARAGETARFSRSYQRSTVRRAAGKRATIAAHRIRPNRGVSQEKMMRPSRILVAAVLMVVGLVWIGQGTGKIAGSAMSGVSFWAAVGVLLVVLAVAVVAREWWVTARRSRSGPG
jgi:hypothetical protein